ncbi:MAG TPA: hypothetical protein PLB51_00560 [Candidatus Paceibacterota bacterium]|nr:hypothetical protein [Candidatus Paceibacterota bacterium]
MIIGFLGKGGSGKSTLSTHFTKYLAQKKYMVLAIDGDHNMDMSYLLGNKNSSTPYLGNGLGDLLEYKNKKYAHYSDMLFDDERPQFSIHPKDAFTKKYSVKISRGIDLMIGGPHTDNVKFGQSCSHVLTTPLKSYLPLVKFSKKQAIVLDEKAGSDGAGTGIATGLTLAIICVEPTPQSIKAAKQIAELLTFFGTPYEYIVNKYKKNSPLNGLDKKPLALIPFSEQATSKKFTGAKKAFSTIEKRALNEEQKDTEARFKRSKQKFERNKSFKNTNS